jgi:uncharacterized protein YgfB (UPF0149 family)
LAACHGEAVPLQDVMELLGAEALTDGESVETFVAASVADLQAEDLSFAPLLPGEEAALSARLDALGEWCGSFLAGFAAGVARRGVGSLDDCPEEVREVVRDFAAIAQVDVASAAASDDDAEEELMELEEFVKVGALLIMSSLDEIDVDETDDPAG